MNNNRKNPPSNKHHHFGSLENTATRAVETEFENALQSIVEEETTMEKFTDIQQQAVAFTSVLKDEVEEVLLKTKKKEPTDDDNDDEKADNHHELTRKQVDELLHVEETPPIRHSPTTPTSEGIPTLQQGLSKTILQVSQGIATATHTVVDALSNKNTGSQTTTTTQAENDGTVQYRLSNDLVEVFPTEPK